MAKLDDTKAQPVTAGDLRPGSNSMMQLLSFVERLERLDEERGGIVDDMKEVREEAKGMGFDTKILGQVLRRRKMDAADRQEADAMLELYEDAVRQAEKQQVAQSVAEGSDKPVAPAAKAEPKPAEPKPAKKKWGAKKAEAPKQTDVETWPDDSQVQAEAARQITHAADHPEKEEAGPGAIPAFLRR